MASVRNQVFVSYSREDADWLKRLQVHLKPLERDGLLDHWDDTRIKPGDDWRAEIEAALAAAIAAVLLVSADFLASDFIDKNELPPLLDAAKKSGVVILPVIVGPCLFEENAGLSRFQAVNRPSDPLTGMAEVDQDRVLVKVARAVLNAVAKTQEVAPSNPPPRAPLARMKEVDQEREPVAMARAAGNAVAKTQAAVAQSNLPPRNPFFTGREAALAEVRQALAAQGRAALSGLGGAGKTQTSIEYAHLHAGEYTHTFWTNAASQEAVISGYVALAGLLGLKESGERDQMLAVNAVKNWLGSNAGWLLILDNADDIAMVRGFVPEKNGHVLLTTRAHALGGLARLVEIKKMEPEEGGRFLLRRAGLAADDAALGMATGISKELLDGLPLALDQAGAYIEETQCGLSGYVEIYQKHGIALLKRRGEERNAHPDPVATTWAASFEKIAKANPAAADLLRMCAFLGADAIPEELLSRGLDELAFNDAIKEILKYSLLNRDPQTRMLEIHRLVQRVLQQEMDEATQRVWAERAVRAVNKSFPYVEFSNWPVCERLLPQAQVCAGWIERWKLEFPEAARLLNQAGYYLNDRGRFRHAEVLYKRALAIRENVLGPDHSDLAMSLNNLADLYREQGEYAKAAPLLERSLAIKERAHPEDQLDVALSLNNLAELSRERKEFAKAEPLYKRALEIFERELGPEHSNVATCVNNLAALYEDQKEYDKAENLYQRSLAIRRKVREPNHPEVGASLNNLAGTYFGKGDYDKAETLYKEALEILGQADHYNLAQCLDNYAFLLESTGRATEGAEFRARAAASRARAAAE